MRRKCRDRVKEGRELMRKERRKKELGERKKRKSRTSIMEEWRGRRGDKKR